jgi:hypothetical protein
MTLPTFATMITVDTLEALEAALLADVSDAGVSSWATESPQFGLLHGEALMARTFQEQRLILAYTASPRQILRLRAKLIDLGYSAADAATITASWVDVSLGWYGEDMVRIPAQKAEWTIGVKVTTAAAPLTIDGTSQAVIQADNGTFFELIQDTAVTLNSTSSYKGTVRIRARAGGSAGNVLVGSITIFRGAAGLSIDDTVTQVLALAGREQETDEAVVARAQARWGTIGTAWSLDAFDYWIPTVAPSVTRWRVRDDNPRGPGTVVVKLATEAGAASTEECDAVFAKLDGRAVRALGSGQLYVEPADEHPLTISATLRSDGTNATLATDAGAALVRLGKAFPLGIVDLVPALVTEVLMGAAVDSLSAPGGPGTVLLTPRLAGFDGVEDVTALSLSVAEELLDGEVLIVTPDITVI